MKRPQLLAGVLLAVIALVYAGNCVKNVVVLRRVRKVCPALWASSNERLENSRAFFTKLFQADAPLMMRMPDAVVGKTCTRLEQELVWYQWNLGRSVRMEETRALRQELIAVIDRAQPSCVDRVTKGMDVEPSEFDVELAATSCQMLKTLRAGLDTPVQDASPWLLAEQLERLSPTRGQTPRGPRE